MRHLNTILKVGLGGGGGTIFYFSNTFGPSGLVSGLKVHFRPAHLVSLLGKDRSLSHLRMVMVSHLSR